MEGSKADYIYMYEDSRLYCSPYVSLHVVTCTDNFFFTVTGTKKYHEMTMSILASALFIALCVGITEAETYSGFPEKDMEDTRLIKCRTMCGDRYYQCLLGDCRNNADCEQRCTLSFRGCYRDCDKFITTTTTASTMHYENDVLKDDDI